MRHHVFNSSQRDLLKTEPETPCIACGGRNPNVIAGIDTARLCRLYLDKLGVAVERFFKGVSKTELMACPDCGLLFYTSGAIGDAAFYEELQQFPWYYQGDKQEYATVAELIPAGSRVLEVGCGSGAFTEYLDASCEYTGLEFNSQAVQKAVARGLNVQKLPVAEFSCHNVGSQMDVVCSFQVMEHVPEPDQFLRDCAAAAKPGGRVIMVVPSEDSPNRYALDEPLNMPPHHQSRWTQEALQNLMVAAGLVVERVIHDGAHTFPDQWRVDVLARAYMHQRLGIGRRLDSHNFLDRIIGLFLSSGRISHRLFLKARDLVPYANNGHSITVVATRP